ncbi:MAG: hypothetical protein KUG77_29625, partial [Nannocystaceae bacterium]|nr:hypothetical protein [Nannocystaceae bacterium]
MRLSFGVAQVGNDPAWFGPEVASARAYSTFRSTRTTMSNDHDVHHNTLLDEAKAATHEVVVGVENLIEDVAGNGGDHGQPYRYDYDFIAPLAMLDGVPWRDLPSEAWLVKVGLRAAEILLNLELVRRTLSASDDDSLAALGEGHPLRSAFKNGSRTPAADRAAGVRSEIASLSHEQKTRWFERMLSAIGDATAVAGPASSLAAYDQLFQSIPRPAIAETFQLDSAFANFRVAGPNPTSLFRVSCDGLPAKFPLTSEQYRRAVGEGDSLSAALEDGRLYMVDYEGQQPTLDGTFPQWKKYGFEPMALFVVPLGGDRRQPLAPVAIQCGQDPATNPIHLPGDGSTWLEAKTVVQVADGNFHELVAHLGRTHLLLEPFPIATKNLLPEGHPLRTLLEPHFVGTLFINWAAGAFLVAPKNFVDKVLSGTIDADRVTSVTVSSGRSFNESFLPTWLAAQGVDDPEKLPVYPFRDDALLLWDAIGTWARAYVSVFWPSDEAVQADGALQRWARDLAAFDGGRVSGFGDCAGEGIQTAAYLGQAIQMIIFTASAMHAAVNFPQGDIMDYAPAMPLAGYTAGPRESGGGTPKDWLDFLPPLPQALTQLNITYLLGNVHETQLGRYGEGY